MKAILDGRTVREMGRFQKDSGGLPRVVDVLVTASPFDMDGTTRSILVLDDVSELAQLNRLISICMRCKKIRNDQ